jgi:hypothetical protein
LVDQTVNSVRGLFSEAEVDEETGGESRGARLLAGVMAAMTGQRLEKQQQEPPHVAGGDGGTEKRKGRPQPSLKKGVVTADGDGAVTLVSVGFMCARGWTHPEYTPHFNPSRIPVVLREYESGVGIDYVEGSTDREGAVGCEAVAGAQRGCEGGGDVPLHGDSAQRSTASSDHVDILGNFELMRDVLLLAAGKEHGVVTRRVFSEVDEISSRVPPPPPLA